MKKLILLFFFTIVCSNAQTNKELIFNKRNVECEDKWVAFPMDKDSTFMFGFIYIDQMAGLTLNHEGKFKITKSGKFELIGDADKSIGFIKARLQPNNNKLAEIPENKFSELKIKKIPDWLSVYKAGEGTIERLYRWGYLYNGYGECEKALTFLLEAEKKDSNYKGLQIEIAYSYNHLGKYELAEKCLNKAIKHDPNDCYLLKELAFTYTKQKNYEKAVIVLDKMKSKCEKEENYIIETTYNLAYEYYAAKNKVKFNEWKEKVNKIAKPENIYYKYVLLMEKDLNK